MTTCLSSNLKFVTLTSKRFLRSSAPQVSDITYIWTNEGWVYLAAVKDLYSKEGHALNKRMTSDLVCQALNNAIKYKRPANGLIIHSDRGSQYCSHQYRQIIDKHGFRGSMSRRGNCYDNAPIESFLGEKHCFTRKNELVFEPKRNAMDNAGYSTFDNYQFRKSSP